MTSKSKIWLSVAAAVLVLCATAYFVLAYLGKQTVRKELDRTIATIPALKDISYDVLQVDLIGSRVYMQSLLLHIGNPSETVSIDEAVLYDYRIQDNIPHQLKIDLKGIHLDPRQNFMGNVGDQLQAMGCRIVQGYHYARPVDADELPGILEQIKSRLDASEDRIKKTG